MSSWLASDSCLSEINNSERINLDEALPFLKSFPKPEAMKDAIEKTKMEIQAITDSSSKMKIQLANISDNLLDPFSNVVDKGIEAKQHLDALHADIESVSVETEKISNRSVQLDEFASSTEQAIQHITDNLATAIDTSL